MGSLIVQLGQAGNQIGLKLWDELRSMHNSNTDFLFRDGDTVTHSIMIDTEPKVLRQIKHDRGTYFYYDPSNIVYYQHGRGNNWALGYYNTKTIKKTTTRDIITSQKMDNLPTLEKAQLFYKIRKTKQAKPFGFDKESETDDIILKENATLLEQTSNLIQKEIERIDYYTSTMMIYSLAGGTGSGFGSRVLESLRDDYSMNMIYNTVVFPSLSGENPLQQYNCMLSLSHLQDFSDGIIYFQNDKMYRCLSRMGVTENTKPVNMDDLNEYCAGLLANLMKVNDMKTPKRFYTDYLSDLTCMNECKFVEMFGSPFMLRGQNTLGPEASWENVINQTFFQTSLEMDDSSSKQDVSSLSMRNDSLAVKCLLRAPDIDTSYMKNELAKKHLEKKINTHLAPLKWNPDAVTHEILKEKVKSVGDSKNLLVLANRVHIAGILKEMLETARSKYKAKAYLHWYYKYGMEEDDFLRAFENIEMIVDNYRYLMN